MKKNRKFLFLLISLIVVTCFFYANNKDGGFVKLDEIQDGEITCTRKTRLKNEPCFDRALSIVNERYSVWEQGGYANFGTYYFFPSQLVNCIKIIEEDLSDSGGVEGYFIFNDDSIKTNYFPIYVDENYNEADDLVTALLLVHEITHVRQYLDLLNDVDELSCIDKETEAFDAAYNFAWRQYGENKKIIDLRLENDENLHPQLQIYKNITDSFPKVIVSLSVLCPEGPGGNCGDLITKDRKDKIKSVISSDPYYIDQCDLE